MSRTIDLASAYVVCAEPRPELALHHLRYVNTNPLLPRSDHESLSIAATLAPGDPEIAFNLAVMFEASKPLSSFMLGSLKTLTSAGYLEEALEEYKRSKDGGVERAAMHIRNVYILLHLYCPRLINRRSAPKFSVSDCRPRKSQMKNQRKRELGLTGVCLHSEPLIVFH